jgi:hypothetical protein
VCGERKGGSLRTGAGVAGQLLWVCCACMAAAVLQLALTTHLVAGAGVKTDVMMICCGIHPCSASFMLTSFCVVLLLCRVLTPAGLRRRAQCSSSQQRSWRGTRGERHGMEAAVVCGCSALHICFPAFVAPTAAAHCGMSQSL